MLSAGRGMLLPAAGFSLRPIPAADEPLRNVPRVFTGGVRWFTTGRANARCGGTAADRLALGPIKVERVGLTSGLRTALIRPNSFGETRTLFRATGRELMSVSRETAVNPFGERIFA